MFFLVVFYHQTPKLPFLLPKILHSDLDKKAKYTRTTVITLRPATSPPANFPDIPLPQRDPDRTVMVTRFVQMQTNPHPSCG